MRTEDGHKACDRDITRNQGQADGGHNSAAPVEPAGLTLQRVDYGNPTHAAALLRLLDAYAQDPMGGGAPLPAFVRTALLPALAARSDAFSLLAWLPGVMPGPPEAVGLLNAFEGFSTFTARPLLNVHDLAVLPAYRGHGIATHLLQAAEQHARARGCCKLTLEVLPGNDEAMAVYRRFGFAGYRLRPEHGEALFWQKWLECV